MTYPEYPEFNAALCLSYEEGLCLVRGYLRSYGSAELPALLTQCCELGQPIDEADLYQLYQGSLQMPEPALIRTLLEVLSYPTQLIAFEVGPVTGSRHYFFLESEEGFRKITLELAAFSAKR